eukprot:CAMPEP_0204309724 /NCGR_PEP_ID=MMETSP0469-20131031/1265_1 /ASSEMBLY_ACC=CAM_ASM_000384 /TAXON_ID=2969 /ORGANISM="Oxyrrhis marina" /LENGTH=520 /DNA_ID=CAMNT_0051289377 /DNA_START=16 /DNA_END=1578 /DNA_ORIENTATION=+
MPRVAPGLAVVSVCSFMTVVAAGDTVRTVATNRLGTVVGPATSGDTRRVCIRFHDSGVHVVLARINLEKVATHITAPLEKLRMLANSGRVWCRQGQTTHLGLDSAIRFPRLTEAAAEVVEAGLSLSVQNPGLDNVSSVVTTAERDEIRCLVSHAIAAPRRDASVQTALAALASVGLAPSRLPVAVADWEQQAIVSAGLAEGHRRLVQGLKECQSASRLAYQWWQTHGGTEDVWCTGVLPLLSTYHFYGSPSGWPAARAKTMAQVPQLTGRTSAAAFSGSSTPHQEVCLQLVEDTEVVQVVEHIDPPAIVMPEASAQILRAMWESQVEVVSYEAGAGAADTDSVSEHSADSYTLAVDTALVPRWETVTVLLLATMTRTGPRLWAALDSSPVLEPIAAQIRGFRPAMNCGRVYVHMDCYQSAAKVCRRLELQQHHVVLAEPFLEHFRECLQAVPCRKKIRVRELSRIGFLNHTDHHGWAVRKTFLSEAVAHRAPKSVSQSTCGGGRVENSRRLVQKDSQVDL